MAPRKDGPDQYEYDPDLSADEQKIGVKPDTETFEAALLAAGGVVVDPTKEDEVEVDDE